MASGANGRSGAPGKDNWQDTEAGREDTTHTTGSGGDVYMLAAADLNAADTEEVHDSGALFWYSFPLVPAAGNWYHTSKVPVPRLYQLN